VDAPEGRVASVAINLPAIYFSADYERSVFPKKTVTPETTALGIQSFETSFEISLELISKN